MALGLVLALGSRFGQRAGAGIWARRTVACLAVMLVTGTAMAALFDEHPTVHALLALLALGLTALAVSRPTSFELFTLSAAALGLNAVLVGGFARLLFDGPSHGEPIGKFLVLGLVAAALLAGTVSGVLRLSRAAEQTGGAA